MPQGQKKGFKHSQKSKDKISNKLKNTACGGFNVKIKCPLCEGDMNPANLSRHIKACENNLKYSYIFPKKITSRQFKHFRGSIRRSYGVSFEKYVEMFDKQNGLCCICQKKPINKPLCVDHCHKTGKVRGLLCSHCNFILGFCKDKINILESAIEYLKKYYEKF